MEIKDILDYRVVPFEIKDEKIEKLFSYFLHLAPTIESESSSNILRCDLDKAWTNFLANTGIKDDSFHFYAPGNLDEKKLYYYYLSGCSPVNKNRKGFICCRKSKEESEPECLLRHIRNSIAHSNVFLLKIRRKFILFDDFNKNGNQTARILFSQTDLSTLKRDIVSVNQ